MSWLNFNESLNSIKGQLSNFASGVLADGIVVETEQDGNPTKNKIEDLEEPRNTHSAELQAVPSSPNTQNANSWSWEPPGGPPPNPPSLDLQKKIQILENEKKELIVSLEQLDLDCQQTTDKLVTLKDNLQASYNELKSDFEKLQKEYGEVLTENMAKSKEIASLKMVCANKNQFEKLEKDYENFEEEHARQSLAIEKSGGGNDKEFRIAIQSEEEVETLKKELEELSRKNTKLLTEKETLHEKYLNIITENMQKYMEVNETSLSTVSSSLRDDPQILEFAGKVESLLKLLLDFKCKTETLEEDLCGVTQEKNKTIAEKNFEIEKLLKNSEILSQEVITKTQAIKDYEDECGELMKNNDLLISELQNYKNSSGLQTISESNEDNLLLLETQLENANKKIADMEILISDLESSKQEGNLETQTELDYIKKQLNLTGQELSQSKEECEGLKLRFKELEGEKENLDKVKLEYENIEYKYTEVNVSMETLKEENEEYKSKLEDLINGNKKLEFNYESKVELLQNVVDDLKQKLEAEMENNSQKEVQIRNLIERLQNSKMCETGLKLQVDTIYKELQVTLEGKQALESKCEEDLNKLRELEERLKELSESEVDLEFAEMSKQNQEMSNKISLLETQLAEVTSSQSELVSLITAKHQENLQYHAEIQRLNHFLSQETEKTHVLEIQLHNLKSQPDLTSQNQQLTQNLEKLTDQNNFLREKSQLLAQNLLQEQSNVQKILAERLTTAEKEQTSTKELERLRAHLVEIEEMYTHELLQAEQKNKEMMTKVNEIEQREKDSSSIYTSVSIRANQQVETLQTQLQLVTNQRDELRIKVSDLEDEHNKQVAALTNLQLVLEQFQKERDKDVFQETERIRRQVNVEKQIQQELRGEISSLRLQLDESKQGLLAASRLTDQLEKCRQQIVSYKDEVTKLQDQIKNKESKFMELSTQTDTKVDKTLIKNLIVGYITSHSSDQNQILKIIATVLDFNQTESDKVELNKPQFGGWLTSILHPQNLNSNQDITQQSLSEAFVRFLEKESKPKVLPNLLITNQARKDAESSSSTTPRQSPSPHVLSDVLLPTFGDFGKSRNSSSILKDVLKDNNS